MIDILLYFCVAFCALAIGYCWGFNKGYDDAENTFLNNINRLEQMYIDRANKIPVGNGQDYEVVHQQKEINRLKSHIKALEMDKEQLEFDVENALCNLGNVEAMYEDALKKLAERKADNEN